MKTDETSKPAMTRRDVLAASAMTLAAAALPQASANAQQKAPGTKTVPEYVTPKELEEWTMRFVAGFADGIPLVKLFEQLAGQTKNEALRQFSTDAVTFLLRGYRMSDFFAMNRHIFDEKYVTTLRYGEIYGCVDESLERWLQERRKERK